MKSLTPARSHERAKQIAAAGFFVALAAPSIALACACGCSVFDVGNSTLLPSGPGATLFLEYDYLAQTTNWRGGSSAPSSDNNDKHIRSDFILAGGQYMFNEDWGAMVEVPVTHRGFVTTDPDNPGSFNHTALGDIRVMGVYSGFSPDMSTGLLFGAKLPTGDHKFAGFDPDVQIGSGSTDILLGGYHSGALVPDQSWNYFGQILWQKDVATQEHYRPGYELNGAAGISYNGFKLGNFAVAPSVQTIVSNRGRDGDAAGDAENTGYTRILVAPGVSVSKGAWTLYADAEVAVAQNVYGNQLMAPVALKFIASYNL